MKYLDRVIDFFFSVISAVFFNFFFNKDQLHISKLHEYIIKRD